MRRSNSTCHIPMPKNDRTRSKSSVRSSIRDNPGSTSKTRAGSIERLTLQGLKRTNSTSNLKKSVGATPLGASKTNTNKKSTALTPTLGLPGFKRSTSNLVTPGSARSRSRSPFKIGSERAVNDKKWVSQQFAKVRRYLQEHTSCAEHIPETLKPPTINTFVYVMNLLLKEINPHIEISMANYKEVVFNMLKILHYPGNISNSLLKTVNTMHAWPQVISILAWLVDLVTIIRRVEQPIPSVLEEDHQYRKIECVTEYIIERYLRYNNNEEYEDLNEALVKKFAQILNINEEENKQLEEEVTTLEQLKEKQMKSIAEQKSKNDAIKENIDHLQNEIDAYYLNREEKQEDINCLVSSMKEKKAKLIEKIKTKKASIAKLAEAIKVQPCTVHEKKNMLKHIEEMKHNIDLKKEKIKTQKSIKDDCDVKLTEARKKVVTEVYRLNTNLMKLSLLEPDLKILQLKETEFLSLEFQKDVQALVENIKVFENKFNTEISQMKSFVSKMKEEMSLLEQQIESTRKNIQTLTESEYSCNDRIETCSIEMDTITKKRENHKQSMLHKINEMKKAEATLIQLQSQLREVTEMKNKKQAQLECLKEQSVEFFVKVNDIVMGNLVNMNDIRSEIFDMLANCLKQVEKTQNDICEDLHKLDELQDH